MTQAMDKIRKASEKLSKVCNVLTGAVPAVLAAYWIALPFYPEMGRTLPAPLGPEVDSVVLFLAFVASMIPGLVTMYGILTLKHLLELYRQGKVFQPENVTCYRRLGHTMLALAAARFITTPILGLVLTMNAPPGGHLLVLDLSGADVLLLLAGSAVTVIARVMDLARGMHQEYQQIV